MLEIHQPYSFLADHLSLHPSAGRGKNTSVTKNAADSIAARVYIFEDPSAKRWAALLGELLNPWQLKTVAQNANREMFSMQTPEGPVLLVRRQKPKGPFSHGALLEDSTQAWYREQGGQVLSALRGLQVMRASVMAEGLSDEAWLGLFLGFELSAYQFKSETQESPRQFPFVEIQMVSGASGKKEESRVELALQKAKALGQSTNWARHLVNLPPNVVNPVTVAESALSEFRGRSGMKVEVWDEKRLKQEKMGLHLGVGQGSATPPRLVHFRYRPGAATKSKRAGSLRPVAIVGKGVTFDTGGLDIKPSAGMRLMKKDMGGAAAVFALAWWASEVKYPAPLDFYLALAENAVDGKSFRPSDILMARNGKSVEIHNTDAEGRLVLADALDVAVTQTGAHEPEVVIDLATLTGAIKVALGGEIAGLFSNDDRLAKALNTAGTQAGELNWRMPMLSRYASGFSSPFADLVNAVDGFGGAITAALFLERFVRNKAWAHLDIYAWTDKATGSLTSVGANGQGVQTLVHYLETRAGLK